MIQPNQISMSVQERNPAGGGVSPIPVTQPNIAPKPGSITSSIGTRVGNNVAYHAADALRRFGNTFGNLNVFGSKERLAGGAEKKGGSGTSSPPHAPFSHFGKFRPLFPLAP